MELNKQQVERFREELADYYAHHARHDLPWRQPGQDGTFDPYKIMVSELMLQQTQVGRVVPKYNEFLVRFPNAHALATVGLGDVLRMWQGLGYNRRGKFLWQAAQIVDKLKYFPGGVGELTKLPGVGPNTAGAIMAYAFNEPVVFVETNIRTVYIHHFFNKQTSVADRDICEPIEQTLDHENPREFYWALMDYGSHLKASVGNLNKASKHYVKQSTFHGSRRQIRGQVIRTLGNGPCTEEALERLVDDNRLLSVLRDLENEALIVEKGGVYSLE